MNNLGSNMNESGTEDQDQFEPVLLVPPRLTKSSYATLLSLDCVPRKWHLAGRHGSRTHKILDDDNDASVRGGRIGIPLIKSPENIQLITSMMANKNVNDGCKHEHDHEHADLQNLLSTPGVELIFKPPVPSNKIPKEEILDATIHPNRKPDGYQLKLKEILQQAASSSSSSLSAASLLEVNNSKHIIRPWKRNKPSSEHELQTPAFTFCELFAGIGGFGIALEALGGKCVFASEIYEPSKRLYEANLDVTHLNPNPNVPGVPPSISGDIWDIQSKDIPPHDLLVGGFPCQPFSTLGDQPGLQDGKHSSGRKNTKGTQCGDGDGCGDGGSGSGSGRGQLFTQIARILRDVQPKAFLLENVPGLITTDGGNALKTIISTLEEVGYRVSFEVCSSRGLTAQSRKRLYIVGLRKRKEQEQEQEQEQDRNTGFAVGLSGAAKDKPFQFPFIPDLQLRAGDVLHTPEELACATSQSFPATGVPNDLARYCGFFANVNNHNNNNNLSTLPSSAFRLTDAQMDQLRHRSKSWKSAKLAWDNTTCDTIDSHYGVSVGKVSDKKINIYHSV